MASAKFCAGINVASSFFRCKSWIQNCGNESLLSKGVDALHSRFFICREHFTDDQFYNHKKVTLIRNAIPTQFEFEPLNDIVMQHYPIFSAKYALCSKYSNCI